MIKIYSFYNWCIDNKKDYYLDLWDYELNIKFPDNISYATHEKFYFKCNNSKHKSYQKGIWNLISSKDLVCPECNSFYQWCIDNNKQYLIKYWDCERNSDNIHFVSKGSSKKYWFNIDNKCSYNVPLVYITGDKGNDPLTKYYNSFGYYLLKNFGEEFINKVWSNKNSLTPYDFDRRSIKKIFINCIEKEYHGAYQTTCDQFVNGCRCPMCSSKIIHPLDSFAEFQKKRFGDNWVEKCWCTDNKIDPFKISIYKNSPKVHIKCYNISYHDFWITPMNYSHNKYGCPYCGNGSVHHKTHKLDSIGEKYSNIVNIWSSKNKISPYEVSEKSHKKIWLKC